MNILIIGNGFDLAHGLPTRYNDFLEFSKILMAGIDAVENNELMIFEVGNEIEHHIEYYNYIKMILNEYDGLINKRRRCVIVPDKTSYGHLVTKYQIVIYHDGSKTVIDKDAYKTDSGPDAEWGDRIADFINFKRLLQDNYWIQHFFSTYVKSNWVDFETEIAKICSVLEKEMEVVGEEIDKESCLYFSNENMQEKKFIEYFLDGDGAASVLYEVQEYIKEKEMAKMGSTLKIVEPQHDYKLPASYLFKIRDKLVDSLERLTVAFELYLLNVVEAKRIKKKELFEKMKIDKVLSFNYTHTCLKYDFEESEYIHGEVRGFKELTNGKQSPLVLGMNESLEEDKASNNTNAIKFKKYYQRIRKNSNGDYKRWCEYLQFEDAVKNGTIGSCYDYYAITHKREKSSLYDSANNPTEMEGMFDQYYSNNTGLLEYGSCVYVFGHSLDITDGDVLRQFIDYDNIKVVIFYYNEKDLDDKIENLVKMIGRQKLIRRRGSKHQSIFFQNSTTGEII